jgi:hypothetical protein
MATVNNCDLCGTPAIDTIEVKSKNTTPIKVDVCESHLAEYKKTMREFTGQDLKEKPDPEPVIESREVIKEVFIASMKDAQPE